MSMAGMGLMGLVAGAVALLSLEIGRIEREWVNDARSYPRRARN
ncbi:MAG: hypothetical protein WCC28_11000 [Mycobacterium sp.]